jgi:VIT1/CCC1 family predicted Fe2+/Mn2+ transporter
VSPPSHLKPSESLTEIVAGLIMVLTFTLAASVLTGGGQDGARAALLGAIGCNAAWGIIDAVFYMMTSAFDRNRRLRLARAIAATQDEAAALAAIRSELDPYLASVTRAEDRERLYRSVHNLLAHGRLPRRTSLLFDDVMGAIEVFCIALAASLPAALPLLLIHDPWLALRTSNLLVVGLLFVVGYHWAKYIDASPWAAGLGLMGLGLALVAVAILLGG